MPPWKPVNAHGIFKAERAFSEADIQMIVQWASNGAPEGSPGDLPMPVTFPETWALGPPDAAVQPAEAYQLPANSSDVYRCFPMTLNTPSDVYVRGYEVIPGNRKIVHHVLLFLDESGQSVPLDNADPGPGYTCFGGTGFLAGVGGLGGGFGDYVGGLRKVGLDVALVIDTSDSMQFVIDDVKKKLSQLVGTIQRMVPTSRIGIVVYRDKGDDYVVKWTDLSFRTDKLQDFLSHIGAGGGGDWEEAVKEALDAAVNELKWRKQSKKIIILVGGSPPHQWDVDAVHDIVRAFRKDGGYISTIDVTKQQHDEFDRQLWRSLHGKAPYQPKPMPAFYADVSRSFGAIAKDGGGELISLDADRALIRSVFELTFGSRWKVEMAKYLKEIS